MTIVIKIDNGRISFAIVPTDAEPKVKGDNGKYAELEYVVTDYNGLFSRLKGWLNGTNNSG